MCKPFRRMTQDVCMWEKSISHILNMDIILTKMHVFSTGSLYSCPGAVWGTFYYGCTHFIWLLVTVERKHLPTAMIILGIAGFFFYISLIGFVILKLYSQRANGLIIIFGWTNRLIQPSYLPFISNSLWSLLSIYEWLFFITNLFFSVVLDLCYCNTIIWYF